MSDLKIHLGASIYKVVMPTLKIESGKYNTKSTLAWKDP